MRLHRCHVGILSVLSTYTGCIDTTDKVVVVTSVPVKHKVQAVVEETEVNTKVKLMLLLIGKLLITKVIEVKTDFVGIGHRTPRLVRIVDCSCIGD